MTLSASTVATPFGPMTMISRGATLLIAGFGDDVDAMRDRLPAQLRQSPVRPDDTHAASALRDYFGGDVDALNAVAVEQPGGPFFGAVWREMRAIPAGTTISYA